MKYLKSRNKFLIEEKVKDVIFPRQAKAIIANWGAEYLDYEEVTPTDKIEQGRWKLSLEDKYEVLKEFTGSDVNKLYELFNSLPDAFNDFISSIVSKEIPSARGIRISEINIQNPTLDEMCFIFENIFRKISVNDTISDSVISRNERGVPIKDDNNNMIMVKKTPGDLVFSNNMYNINYAVDDYNTLIDRYVKGNLGDKYKLEDKIPGGKFDNQNLKNFLNYARGNENHSFEYDFEIFNKDIYLSIKHNPKDILNMSISKFFASCQHLYSGGYRDQLLGNVFDPNSIPAFLTFDTPIYENNEKISDTLPLSRMVIRNLESFDDKTTLYFDRAYPDRMQRLFSNIVEKYTSNRNTEDANIGTYIYSPDIDINSELNVPYHDRFQHVKHVKNIGLNTKTLYLNKLYDWKDAKISKNSEIKELVIETTDIPDELLKINLNIDWVKFKLLTINSLDVFSKIKFNSIAFDKCKFKADIFDDIYKNTPNIKKIKLISCNNIGLPSLSRFKSLEEIHFIFTLDSIEELKTVLEGVKIKKLGVSGDIIINKECKEYINSLRSKGIKVEIVGPSI
jgi:hypothetical protein